MCEGETDMVDRTDSHCSRQIRAEQRRSVNAWDKLKAKIKIEALPARTGFQISGCRELLDIFVHPYQVFCFPCFGKVRY